jgi:cystathionine beta-lyase/cystathionine gamma-synthase
MPSFRVHVQVRFAIGIENVEDVWADVLQALAHV